MTLSAREKAVLKLIDDNISYENYFFNKVSDIKWFYPLKEKGCFLPQKAPGPKPAEQKGYFTIPRWNVLPYLEKVSQQVNIPGNEKYADELLTIIKEVSNYKDASGQHIDNYHTWYYFVKILCNLPTEKITDEIIGLIPVWLESKFDNTLPACEILERLLPKFLDSDNTKDLQKAEKIVDIVTQIKWVPKYTEQQKKEIKEKYKHIFDKPEEQRTEEEKVTIAFFRLEEEEPKTIIDTYWLKESFINKKIASKVGEKCSENVIFNLANKLKNIFEKRHQSDKLDLSYIWFRSLFATPSHIYNAEEIIALILRDILASKAIKNIEITKEIINKFLSEEYKYPLFRRLILFVIGTQWRTYKDIFWRMLDEDKDGNFFNDPHYEAEVYTILEKYINQFSQEEKEKIRNIIEEKVPQKPHPEEKYRKFYSAYHKQKWYSAVKSDEYFKPLYEKYRNITGEEEEISFRESEVRVGPGPSPLGKEIILKMSNKELAEYLKTFKTVDFWKGPTIGGLADVLKSAVQEKPEKFIDDLNPFLKTGYLYIYKILLGIRDAWEKKKIIDWGELFNFIKEYISPEDFWNDKYQIESDDRKANHLWVVGMIGELIIQGTQDDARAFSEEHFQIAQEILFSILDGILLEKEKILNEQPVREDFVGYALNSSFGKITEALFMLALRIKRTEEKSQRKQPVSWEINIRDKYDVLLNNKIIESYVWLGIYLPYFYRLDKVWTQNKVRSIDIAKGQLWEAFMVGYLSGGRVYDELYELMRPHYEKAIGYPFKEKHSDDQLVQHICIGYLRGIEDIDDNKSLFKKLLDKWNASQIKEMIGFFWIQKRDYEEKPVKSVVSKYKNGKVKTEVIEHKQEQGQEQPVEDEERRKIENKIINFWRWVYENKYEGKQENELTDEDKRILSELCKLTVFLPEITDKNFEWLKTSARYVDIGFHSSIFIEYLNELKDKGQSVNFIGKVYLEMLKNSTPDFREEDIIEIVEFLYSRNKKEEADEICNIYGSRGLEFLRMLYEKNNNRKKTD
ncbi:MAG: hypothetical protein SNJ64_00545 [Endomicrobiia bacterium]